MKEKNEVRTVVKTCLLNFFIIFKCMCVSYHLSLVKHGPNANGVGIRRQMYCDQSFAALTTSFFECTYCPHELH